MEKRIFLKSARTKTVDSYNSIDSVGSIDSIESIQSIQSIEPVGSIVLVSAGFKKAFFHVRKDYFNTFFKFFELFLGLGTPLKSSGTL